MAHDRVHNLCPDVAGWALSVHDKGDRRRKGKCSLYRLQPGLLSKGHAALPPLKRRSMRMNVEIHE
jgi:hypothetical protein